MAENIKQKTTHKIPRRILNSILTSLSSGVALRTGAPYIAIGRKKEIAALTSDLGVVAEGGSAMRFIIGRYGSGKSFLLQLIRGYATEQGFVTMDADLSPERRLYGSGGSGLATYRELIKNMSTKASADGGALSVIIERQLSLARAEALERGADPSHDNYTECVVRVIREGLSELRLSVGGFDFCEVLTHYLCALLDEDDAMCAACLRWLRGEYSTKSEAKRTLGFSVSSIPDDDNWYDFIKLWAVYSRAAGYKGRVVMLDECVNLYKITNRISRENNYEKILSMFNDTLSARAEGLMIMFSGTPQFLEDGRRGLFGYEALRSRLCDSRFATADIGSVSGPVIRLRRLSDDEMIALLLRVMNLHAQMYEDSPALKPEQLELFYRECAGRVGAEELMTPREMIRDFLFVLDAMRENSTLDFERLVCTRAESESTSPSSDDEDIVSARERKYTTHRPEDIEI